MFNTMKIGSIAVARRELPGARAASVQSQHIKPANETMNAYLVS